MTNLITKEESDAFLAEFDDWGSLPDSVKDLHIKKSSVYVQTEWQGDLVVWSDSSTINDYIKEAVAYYAYSSYSGTLYGSVSEQDERCIKIYENRLESLAMEKTEYFRGSGKNSVNTHLGYPNSLMILGGCSKTVSGKLIRC